MKTAPWAFGLAVLFAPVAMAQTNNELVNGATDTSNVVNYGMSYNLQRFSTLTQINKGNIKHLVPVWNYSLDDNRAKIPAASLQGRDLRHHRQRYDGDRRHDRQADLEKQARGGA